MKNSPDPEWFHKLEKRLGDYTEEPDADLRNKIAAKISKQRDPVWIPWTHRAATLVSVLLLLWSGIQLINPSIDLNEQSGPHMPSQPTYDGSGSVAREDNSKEPPSKSNSQRVENDKTSYEVNSQSPLQSKQSHENRPPNFRDRSEKETTTTALLIPQNFARMTEGKSQVIKADSVQASEVKTDPIKIANNNTIIVPQRKNRGVMLYVSISPSLSFQKLTPFMNDGVVIEGFNARPVFSADRLGVGLEAGIQTKIAKRFEVYGGFSLYRQSQTLVYEYLGGDSVNASQVEDFDYTLTPATIEKPVKYSMFNLGAETGIIYHLRGDRLAHKIGAGISWQYGMRKISVDESYNNRQSRYLFYQLFYRNEYAANNSLHVFIQPFFKHILSSGEAFNEPFHVRPYRAGVSIGIVINAR